MLGLLQAFVEQVGHMGVKGLAEAVHPAAGKAVDFFGGVWKRWQLNRQRQQQRDEIEAMAKMTAAQVADEIREQLKASIPGNPALRGEVELYLSLAPAAMRASLKRPADPTGRSVPAEFSLRSADDIVPLFPASVPQLRAGDPLPGIDCWVLVELLGAGGFGEVWLVKSEVDDTLRAVKFCTDPVSRQRLIDHERAQVIRVMRAGGHPNLVPLHQYSLTGDKPWLMYEYVGGGTLADAIIEWQALAAEARLAKVVACLLELTAAAAHLHRLTPPLVHRDLKPANVLWCGKTGAFRVTDLGLGGSAAEYELSLESQGGRSLTGRLPSMLGGSHTPLYASPEQRKGHPPDPRDDVHALGVITYQMLTGRLDAGPGARFDRELKAADVPEVLIHLVGDCVDPDAGNRPADAGKIGDALRETGLAAKEEPKQGGAVQSQSQSSDHVPEPGNIFGKGATGPIRTAETALDLRVRGKWWWRPLGNTRKQWSADADAMTKLDLDPTREYRLELASSVTDGDLVRLAAMRAVPSFRRLDMSGCGRVSADGFAQLHPLQQMDWLNCYDCAGLTDVSLMHIAALAGVTRLDLTRCKRITDLGLSRLSALARLEHLDLSGCEWVTDAGLVHLAKMPALRHVGLRNTQVTDGGAARLFRAIPDLTVDR